MVFYWVGLVVKMVLWGVVGLGVLWVWQRGLEGSVEDLGGLMGALGMDGEGTRGGRGVGGQGRRGAWERDMGRGRGRWD